MIYYIPHRYDSPKWLAKIIPLEKQFHFQDGPTVTNMWELKQALSIVSDAVLNVHINADKHDLADWVEFVVKDTDLASALRQHTNRWGLIVALERAMMRSLNLPSHIASRWLSPSLSPFQLVSGQSFHTLEELSRLLDSISDQTIDFHLERHPNDIAQWILLDLGDYQLAELISEASNREQMKRFIEDHLVMLKEAAAA